MIDPDTSTRRAADLKQGDMVDLESIPQTADHPLAEYELCEVLSVEPDGDLLAVSINGVEPVVYLKPDDTVHVG